MGTSLYRGLIVGVLAVTLLGTSAVKAAPPDPPPGPPAGPATAVTALLSVASDGTHGNADSFYPSLSADGSTVAFASAATNLAAPEPVRAMNIFVRFQRDGRTVRVSDAADGGAGDGDSTAPVLSGDGSVVAFESFADNLVSGDINGASDIFVRDRASGRTSRSPAVNVSIRWMCLT